MTEKSDTNSDDESILKPLAIEGKLPLKPVGIENLREANPKHLPPHRYLHPWFARRPTPASRLAILASILPQGTDTDDLLRWMQIGPKEGIEGESINGYIERKKATEDSRQGNLEQHYGYPRPFTSSPISNEISELHSILKENWDGDLPTILDPTAGGGVIPFESLRYGIPTKANELNPVASVILKVMLEYAPKQGSLRSETEKWAEELNSVAKDNLNEYFPSNSSNQIPDSYVSTYSIQCSSCGCEIPLVPKWWVRKRKSSDLVAAQPIINDDGQVTYECLVNSEITNADDFDPDNGPISRGGSAECINCGVVTEGEKVKSLLREDEFDYEIYCVRYICTDGSYGFRAPVEEDLIGVAKAKNRIENDYELSTILSEDRYIGLADRAEPYGITKWRDLFAPRQLVSHYEYLNAFRKIKPEIQSEYNEEKAQAILSLLTLACSKLIDRNCRLSDWDTSKGYPSRLFKGKSFAFRRVFVDNNISIGGLDFESQIRKVLDSYEELVSYLPEDPQAAEVLFGDASSLSIPDSSIQAVVIDPPYYDSIMYAELSDAFYVWMKHYMGDEFSEMFQSELSNKENEAIADTRRYDGVAGQGNSKKQLAKESYENKMSDIFSELYRILEKGGVMTVMFTHKETDAWDTLTMSLINSGFTITSTHPITSEMPQRAGMRENASADSTLLLTGRKPHKEQTPENQVPTLWSDVKSDTRSAAKNAARDLLDSGLSLTKTDIIISAFGPTLRVFAEAHPVVDDEDNQVKPRRALEEAREAVTQILVDEYLEVEGINDLDDVTEWYVLCWLVHETETFSYDEGRQLGLGIGVDIDDIKRSTKTWRKSRGDISLRGHEGRVQNINEKPENRSSRIPVNPDDLSFGLALDKVHAAMHVYDVQGESACCDWLRERNFDSDSTFKSTLQALLQVLPHDHEDWGLARDLAAGRTRDVLDLDFSPNVFAEDSNQTQQKGIDDY